MKLRALVVDDEPLARECITDYISQVDFIELACTASNPVELSQILREQKVDLIFLDIQMPLMNGMDFLRITQQLPMVIITTAYPNYALEGFQLDVMDYLVKPVTFNRFYKAVLKVRDYHQMSKKEVTDNHQTNDDYFFVKTDSRYEKIYFGDVLFIEGMENYVNIQTVKGKFLALLPMKTVEEYLQHQPFIRVHKSFIVASSKIAAMENNEVIIGGHRIPVSRNYREQVLQQVVNRNLWKR